MIQTPKRIDKWFQKRYKEAKTLLKMTDSHDATRSKLHQQLSKNHRAASTDGEPSWSTYPYVQDVFGDHQTGTVVYSQNGQHYAAKYDAAAEGEADNYKVGKATPVQRAYVASGPAKESAEWKEARGQIWESISCAAKGSVTTDLEHLESLAAKETFEGHIINIRESALNANGEGELCLITPGQGTSGYFDENVLRQAATNKVFPKGTQMHLDHDTATEERERPEGSVLRMGASLTGDATFKENGAEGPGLYAPIKAYPDTAPFINARAADMGASIVAGGKSKEATVGGRKVKLVTELFAHPLNRVDFVTRAGRGGKLVSIYESYREANPGPRVDPAQKENEMALVQIEENELKNLRESAAKVPNLEAVFSRLNDRFNRIDITEHIRARVAKSTLREASQKRVLGVFVHPDYVLPVKEAAGVKSTDMEALNKLVDAEVEAELKYLESAGVRPGPVRIPGSTTKETPVPEAEIKEAAEGFEDSITRMMGGTPAAREKKTA